MYTHTRTAADLLGHIDKLEDDIALFVEKIALECGKVCTKTVLARQQVEQQRRRPLVCALDRHHIVTLMHGKHHLPTKRTVSLTDSP
jgi:hypothetical protein